MQLLCKTIRIYMTKKKLITEAIATPQVQYFFTPKLFFVWKRKENTYCLLLCNNGNNPPLLAHLYLDNDDNPDVVDNTQYPKPKMQNYL